MQETISLTPKLLLLCGVIGPLLFIAILLLEGALRPEYDPRRFFGSELALGKRGWVQITNFLMAGLLIFASAFGIAQVLPGSLWGSLFPGFFGLCLMAAGAFVTDPVFYFPPERKEKGPTLHGKIHGANFPLSFGSLVVTTFVFKGRPQETQKIYDEFKRIFEQDGYSLSLRLAFMSHLLDAEVLFLRKIHEKYLKLSLSPLLCYLMSSKILRASRLRKGTDEYGRGNRDNKNTAANRGGTSGQCVGVDGTLHGQRATCLYLPAHGTYGSQLSETKSVGWGRESNRVCLSGL